MTTLAPEEQLLLELINRARLDPLAEAQRQGITLNQFIPGGTLTGDPKQPVAGNNLLSIAAESHTGAMITSKVLTNGGDTHTGAGDGTPSSRVAATGYVANTLSENTWVSGTSAALTPDELQRQIYNLHNGLFVDDPNVAHGPVGGHRITILNDNLKEVGIGVQTGTVFGNSAVTTEDFATSGTQSFLSGVVYNDTKIVNDFYDIGEARQGVTVTVNGVGSDVTGSGGGWTVGMPGGTFTVTYSGGGLAQAVSAIVEAGNRNAKVDLVNGNEIFSSANTTLSTNAVELHLLGAGNINGTGNAGDNTLVGSRGNNILDGGAGFDTAVYAGNKASYTITTNADGSFTVSGAEGIDTLKNIEQIKFADQTFSAAPAGSITINDVTIVEGDAGTKTALFTVSRSGGSAAFDVNFATANDTATAGSDYVANSGVLHFGQNVASQTIAVTVNGDTSVEAASEAFKVLLSGATNGATIGDGQGVATITDDDKAGSITINDVTIVEGNAGTKTALFTVTRSGGSAAFDVNFATANDTATAGSDYVATSGVLHFGQNVTSQTIAVTVNGDTSVEAASEAFKVLLSGATNGATISDGQGVSTITDDDTAPAGSITINDVTIVEGNAGTKTALFTVTRSGGSAAFDVNFATANDTATAGSDYVATSGVLHFGQNVTSQTFSVTINGDTTVEATSEAFKVLLSNATNGAIISDGQGVGTISDDDAAPVNTAPVVTGINASVDTHGTVAASSLFTATDAQGNNTITQYAFWDGGNGGGHFTLNGVEQASGQWIVVSANNLASVKYEGGAAVGSETLFVSAFDGQAWSGNASLVAKTTEHAPDDFNGDGKSDILWHKADGSVALWQMNGTQVVSSQALPNVGTAWHAAGTGDFGGDGKSDVLWHHDDGSVAMWQMNGSQIVSNQVIGSVGAGWDAAAVHDFNGDGKDDILWFNDDTHAVAMWQMNGTQIAANQGVGVVGNGWHIDGAADFNGDGKADILLHSDTGSVAMWQMNGSQITSNQAVGTIGTAWHFAGADDFNGDGKDDILWHNDNGSVAIWQMNGTQILANQVVGSAAAGWNIVGVGDYNNDDRADILWQHDDGSVATWQMNGMQVIDNHGVGTMAGWDHIL